MRRKNNFISHLWKTQFSFMKNRPYWLTLVFFVVLGFGYPSLIAETLTSNIECPESYDTFLHIFIWVISILLETMIGYIMGKILGGIANKKEVLLILIIAAIPTIMTNIISFLLEISSGLILLSTSIFGIYLTVGLLIEVSKLSLFKSLVTYASILIIDFGLLSIIRIFT